MRWRSALRLCMSNIIEPAKAIPTQSKFRKSDQNWGLCSWFWNHVKIEIVWFGFLHRQQPWKIGWCVHQILCMVFIIELTTPVPTQSEFWKSDKNWMLRTQMQYYTKTSRNISRVFSPPAAIQHSVMCTPNIWYDEYFRADSYDSNEIKISKIWPELMAVQSDPILYPRKNG